MHETVMIHAQHRTLKEHAWYIYTGLLFRENRATHLCIASSPARAKNREAPGTHCLCMHLISPRCGDTGIVPCVYSKITYVSNCYHRNWRAVQPCCGPDAAVQWEHNVCWVDGSRYGDMDHILHLLSLEPRPPSKEERGRGRGLNLRLTPPFLSPSTFHPYTSFPALPPSFLSPPTFSDFSPLLDALGLFFQIRDDYANLKSKEVWSI